LAMKKEALEQLLLQEENMRLLQRPYLTEAEEEGHEDAYGRIAELKLKERDALVMKRMFKNYTMEEHLEHLNVTKKWE